MTRIQSPWSWWHRHDDLVHPDRDFSGLMCSRRGKVKHIWLIHTATNTRVEIDIARFETAFAQPNWLQALAAAQEKENP